MLYSEKTELGQVGFSSQVFIRIAGEQVRAREPVMRLCSEKGKPCEQEKRFLRRDWEDCVKPEILRGGLVIRINILIRFGSSIDSSTKELIAAVRKAVERQTGLKPSLVEITVRGMILNNLVSKRHLVIKG